jgi:hypothetical protein
MVIRVSGEKMEEENMLIKGEYGTKRKSTKLRGSGTQGVENLPRKS